MPSPDSLDPQFLIGFRPLIVILGPTAVGKTEIAIQLAERLGGEVVSADSRLFYRGMDIGTAKPTREERKRIPHHLIDVANPDQIYSLAQFQREAYAAIRGIHIHGHLPFLVGGTGQYVLAVTQSWEIPEVKPNQILRKSLENWAIEITPHGLHARLATLDPQAADNIDPNNLRRTIRALEVILCTGKPFSTQRRYKPSPYTILQIGLSRPRQELYARIDERIHQMIEAGLIEEVKTLLAQGYSVNLPTLSAIGYNEIIHYLRNEITLDEAIILMKRRTRVFVRRQANWFKENNPQIHWFHPNNGTLDEITQTIQDWLSTLVQSH
jgi:tRNA dimethylallyltransferase